MTARTPIVDIDHVMVGVPDPEPASAAMQRLGFRVRPFRPLAPLGGGEAGGHGGSMIVMLRPATPKLANYIELARADPETAHPMMRALLVGRDGLAMAVHATSDPDALHRAWSSAGLPSERWSLHLPAVDRSPEQTVDLVMPAVDRLPFAFNAVRYEELANFRIPYYQDHPNSAERWTRVLRVLPPERFEDAARSFAAAYGDDRDLRSDLVTFELGATSLTLATGDGASRTTVGTLAGDRLGDDVGAIDVQVRDLAVLHAALETGGVPVIIGDRELLVAPGDACGCWLHFVSAEVAP